MSRMTSQGLGLLTDRSGTIPRPSGPWLTRWLQRVEQSRLFATLWATISPIGTRRQSYWTISTARRSIGGAAILTKFRIIDHFCSPGTDTHPHIKATRWI